jgi:hypothetical protein
MFPRAFNLLLTSGFGGFAMDNRRLRFAVLFAVYVSLSGPALAYLDPATGSIAIQALIGLVATWVMYSKMFAAKVRTFLARIAGKERASKSE